MSKHANNLRRLGNQAHDCGDWAAAEKLRQAADEIDRLARERDEARAEVERLRGLLLTHAAELVRRQYTAHTEDVADQIKANRAIISFALVRDADAQRRAGIALRDAMKAGQ